MLKRLATAPSRAMRALYDWTIGWSRTRHAPWALFGIAFAESSFFPVPPDVLLIPMALAAPRRWWLTALICTAGSVAGAALGYYIGLAFYETVGVRIVDFYDLHAAMETVGRKYSENAFAAVFTAAFTPIPFKVFTIAGGVFQIPLPMLLAGSVVGRAGRFFLVAGLLRLFGEPVQRFIEKYFDILSLVFVALLIGGFVVVKMMGGGH
ncbi:MAG: cytochrome b561 [Armatimonadota bacterium]|nr:MAG: cytochrome b561 [Armatimonadota bacterium]